MNERIQELWNEAAESTLDDSWEGEVAFMERFAQLIVKQCIDIAYREGDNVAYLALHFGVEQ